MATKMLELEVSGRARIPAQFCVPQSHVPSGCPSGRSEPSVGLPFSSRVPGPADAVTEFYCTQTRGVVTYFRGFTTCPTLGSLLFKKSILGEKTAQDFTIHLPQLSLGTLLPICCKALTLPFSSAQTSNLLSYWAVILTRGTWFPFTPSESLILLGAKTEYWGLAMVVGH